MASDELLHRANNQLHKINLWLYVSRDIRLHIGSGIRIGRKRWRKKHDINIQDKERDTPLKTCWSIKFNTVPDKSSITREYLERIVKRFHKPNRYGIE